MFNSLKHAEPFPELGVEFGVCVQDVAVTDRPSIISAPDNVFEQHRDASIAHCVRSAF